MRFVRASEKHLEPWALLRAELWPDETIQDHREALARLYLPGNSGMTAILAIDDTNKVVGFAEAGLRHDFVNGCDTSPVLFLEGIYVDQQMRRKGVARMLCAEIAEWGKVLGCTEFASDALLENIESHMFHQALGFAETERVVYFRKDL